jgi:hypothetical protein
MTTAPVGREVKALPGRDARKRPASKTSPGFGAALRARAQPAPPVAHAVVEVLGDDTCDLVKPRDGLTLPEPKGYSCTSVGAAARNSRHAWHSLLCGPSDTNVRSPRRHTRGCDLMVGRARVERPLKARAISPSYLSRVQQDRDDSRQYHDLDSSPHAPHVSQSARSTLPVMWSRMSCSNKLDATKRTPSQCINCRRYRPA